MDQLRQNLEDYRRQLDWQSKERGGASSLSRAGESDFREKLRKKDLEIAEQLDKIEVCILSVIYNWLMSDEFSVTQLPVCFFPSSSPHSSLPSSFLSLPSPSPSFLSLFLLFFFLPTSPPSSLPSSFLPPLLFSPSPPPFSLLSLPSLFFSLFSPFSLPPYLPSLLCPRSY